MRYMQFLKSTDTSIAPTRDEQLSAPHFYSLLLTFTPFLIPCYDKHYLSLRCLFERGGDGKTEQGERVSSDAKV